MRTGFSSTKGQMLRSVLYPLPIKDVFIINIIKFLMIIGLINLIIVSILSIFLYKKGITKALIIEGLLDVLVFIVNIFHKLDTTVYSYFITWYKTNFYGTFKS